MQNELRKSYDINEWSILSEIEPSAVGCALCPGSEEKTEETFKIEDKKGKWLVRSIVDPYPLTHPTKFKVKEKERIFNTINAHGWSEVVVETRDHTKELHELPSEEIKNVLKVYAARVKELRNRENVEFIGIIKDNLHLEFEHAYSKIFTLPILPEQIKEKINAFNDYQFKTEKCIYCDIIKKEAKGPRHILENDSFIAFAPFSPSENFEVWIIPKKHYTCISELNDFEIFTLAETIKNILTRLSVAINPFKYGMVFYLRPNKEKDFHFHIKIFQKTLHPTIKEGYGINLCKISPENIAKILRGN
ncbi:MAG: hypothetical protein J7K73_01765 [Nanoarchaeota archaeon]|nr:hypothetical protein [Nanoarchaeota archaeon]